MAEPSSIITQKKSDRLCTWIALVLILFALLVRLHRLGDLGVKDLDEVFHAIVAQNMTHDWSRPMLYRFPAVAYDPYHWQANHIWLHKPPLAMWIIAESFSMFGDTPWALRFPSVLFSAGAMWLVFRIGRRLISPIVGVVGVLVLGVNVSMVRLVQGTMFSDHVDIQLLFWTCVAIDQITVGWLGTQRGKRSFLIAGVATGFALLSKSFPALISLGLLTSISILSWWWRSEQRISARSIGIYLIALLATIAPWFIWCWTQFNDLFRHELAMQLRHLDENVEQWGAPWDRLLFDFLPGIFDMIWPLGVCASVLALIRTVRTRDLKLAALVLWWLGALVPHLLATSKTPSGTLIGWPAFALLVGWLANDALLRRGTAVGAIVGCLLATFAWRIRLPASVALGYPPDYWFGMLAVKNQIILWHIVIGLLCALIFDRLRLRGDEWKIANVIIFVFSIWMVATLSEQTWRATIVRKPTTAFPELRVAAEKFPDDAVILLSNRTRSEHLIAMFWSRRACYDVPDENRKIVIDEVRAQNRRVFILTDSPIDGEIIARVDGLNLVEPK